MELLIRRGADPNYNAPCRFLPSNAMETLLQIGAGAEDGEGGVRFNADLDPLILRALAGGGADFNRLEPVRAPSLSPETGVAC